MGLEGGGGPAWRTRGLSSIAVSFTLNIELDPPLTLLPRVSRAGSISSLLGRVLNDTGNNTLGLVWSSRRCEGVAPVSESMRNRAPPGLSPPGLY